MLKALLQEWRKEGTDAEEGTKMLDVEESFFDEVGEDAGGNKGGGNERMEGEQPPSVRCRQQCEVEKRKEGERGSGKPPRWNVFRR